jgi:hypothetical protein
MCGKNNPEGRDTCQFCGARLTPIQSPTPQNEVKKTPDEEVPEWLQSLRSREGESGDQSATPFGSIPITSQVKNAFNTNPPEPTDENPDWLSRIGGVEETGDQPPAREPVQPAPAEPEPSNELPSWLDGLGKQDMSGPDEEVPDWLENIRRKTDLDGLKQTPPLGVPDVPAAPDKKTGADWLDDLRANPPQPLPPTPEAETGETGRSAGLHPFNDDNIPDWSSRVNEPMRPARTAPLWMPGDEADTSPDALASAAKDLPDWLQKVPGRPENKPPENIPAPKAGTPEIPDFKAMFEGKEDNLPEAIPNGADDYPDWMREMRAVSTPGEESPAAPEAHVPLEPEKPEPRPVRPLDLGGLAPEPKSAEGSAAAPKAAEETPSELAPTPAEEPDWLSLLEEKSGLSSSNIDTGFTTAAFEETSPQPAEQTPVPVDPFVASDLPDWLGELKPAEKTGDEAGKESETEAEGSGEEWLAPADLPSWIQAMRPIESAMPDAPQAGSESNQPIEDHGPLAGLRGVLPVEPNAAAIRRPPTFTPRLEITDKQQSHAELLQSLIDNENEVEPAAEPPLISSQRILRLVIAVALVAIIIYTILSGVQILPLPVAAPAEVDAVYKSISTLSANAPVLVAVDYTPAVSGEMEAASTDLIDHLMSLGARLTFISTSPTGSALTEHLLARVYATPQNYQTSYANGQRVANLGYLAGGQAALLSFASQPEITAPYTIDGLSAWDKLPLQGVSNLAGFARVIVLTENPDTGRIWIEQVQPWMGKDASMLMVTSAQAAPLIRPYADSGQVKGLIAGLSEGAVYEQLNQKAGLSHIFWDSYQVGLWMAILAIVIGGLYYGIRALMESQTAKGGVEQ